MAGVGRGIGTTLPAWMNTSTPGGLNGAAAASAKQNWTEHVAADGRKYYHNKVTKDTTWEKPNELKSADELVAGSCPWKEYTADTGRKYYYNTITHASSWEVPADYKAMQDKINGVDKPSDPYIHPHRPASPNTEKREALSAFKELLTAAGVKPTWSWEMTQGQISTDPRYKAVKSMSDKKQAFSEWQSQKKKTEEDDKRRKDNRIKEDFFAMLKDNKDINPKITWRKAQGLLETDARYNAVDEKDRELLFEEFLYEVERRDRDDSAQNRRDSMLQFKKFLEATPTITVKTQWRKLKEQLADTAAFRALDKMDSLTVFEDHMLDLDKKEEEDQRLEREKLKRDSRKARDAFRELLATKLDNGELTLKTRWRDFVKGVKNDDRYFNMFNTTGSTPHELFCDFLEDLEERLDKDKRILREVMKDINLTVGLTTTFEDFQNTLSSHERFTTIPRQHLKHLFNELAEKAQSKEHSNQKRKKKLINYFKDMMKNVKEITPTSTWVDARPLLMTHKEFEDLDDEQEREKAFNAYKQKAKEEGRDVDSDKEKEKEKEKDKDGSDDDEDRRKHRKKEHKSKKHRHRDDKDRKKKRHSHSEDDEDGPSKKHKRDKRETEDSKMEEGEEGERRDRENGDKREEGEVKDEEERKNTKEEGQVESGEEREDKRRRDDRDDRRHSRRDDRKREDEDRHRGDDRRRREDRDDERYRRDRRNDREEERRREPEVVKKPVEEREEGETDDSPAEPKTNVTADN